MGSSKTVAFALVLIAKKRALARAHQFEKIITSAAQFLRLSKVKGIYIGILCKTILIHDQRSSRSKINTF